MKPRIQVHAIVEAACYKWEQGDIDGFFKLLDALFNCLNDHK